MVKECSRCGKDETQVAFASEKRCLPCKQYNDRNNKVHNLYRSGYARNHIRTPHDIGVYCFKYGDEIIYIGSSDNLPFRIYKHYQMNNTFKDGLSKLHRKVLYRWEILKVCETLDEANHYEKVLINKHNPKFNKIKYVKYNENLESISYRRPSRPIRFGWISRLLQKFKEKIQNQ